MICKVCNQLSTEIFSSKILNKYDIRYYYCETCGFLQTEEPYWLDEAYSESINISDIGYIQRNIGFDFYWNDKFTANLFSRGFEYEDKKSMKLLQPLNVLSIL